MRERLSFNEFWLTVLLPLLMVITVAFAIESADLVSSVSVRPILLLVGTVAFVAGVALAKSQFPYYTAHIYSFVYGVFFLGLVLGPMLPDAEFMTWRERINELVMMQYNWFVTAIDGGSNRDSFIFVVQTSGIFWLLGYTAAWYTVRYLRIWRVILPSGLVLLSVVYYYFGARPLYLYMAAYVVLSLLYITQTFLSSRQRQWRAATVRYEGGISWTFMRSSLLVGLLAILCAWWLPAAGASDTVTSAVNRVNEPWRQFRDSWQRLVAVNSTGQRVADPYRDSLPLGGPRQTGDQPIMDVRVSEELPYAYWRETVLDTYADNSWQVVDGNTITYYPDDGQFNTEPAQQRMLVTQAYINYVSNAGAIYSLPDLQFADRQMYVKLNTTPDGYHDLAATRARYALQLGDQYQVTSSISVADAGSLRRASTSYSPEIREQYLQMPNTISERTRNLAAELTASYDNPYDKAVAVQNWLRDNIEYNDQIDYPPADRELIDYFLFETQEGYCNYYAASMAIMLRSQGVPTRLARGFASGEYLPEEGFYRVRARDAHTWVEVYFPEYGWIQFEPTAIIQPIVRPEGEDAAGGDDDPTIAEDPDQPVLDGETELPERDLEAFLEPEDPFGDGGATGGDGFLGSNTIPFVGGLFLIAFTAFLMLLAGRYNRRVESSVERSYSRLVHWSHWVGVDIRPSYTPYESADVLAAAVPEGEKSIRVLIDEFVQRQFSGRASGLSVFAPRNEWKRLRPILLKRSIRSRLDTFLRRKSS